MTDLFEDITGARSALAKLAAKVPGLGEFMESNDRRAADKLLRDTLARRIGEQRRRIDDLQMQMMSGEGLMLLDDIERAQTNLTTFADSVSTASYGYAGLFAKVKVDSEELAKVYEYDNQLFENVEQTSDAIDQIQAALDSGEGLAQAVRDLNRASRAAVEAFGRRKDVFLGIG